MSRWRRRLLLALLGLVLVTGAASVWVVASEAGLRWSLNQLTARWPEAGLRWAQAEGRLIGPLQLRGVELQIGGEPWALESVDLDWRPGALLAGRLQISTLTVGAVRIDPRVADAPTSPAALPERWQWPALTLPLELQVESLRLGPLDRGGERMLDALRTRLGWSRSGRIEIVELEIDTPQGALRSRPVNLADADLRLDLDWIGRDAPPLRLQLSAAAGELQLQLTLPGGGLDASLHGDGQWRGELQFEAADLRPWWPSAPEALSFNATLSGDARRMVVAGALANGPYPLRRFEAELRGDADGLRWTLVQFKLQPQAGGELSASGHFDRRDATLELQLAIGQLPLIGLGADPEASLVAGSVGLSGSLDALQIAVEAQLASRFDRGQLQARLTLSPQALRLDELSWLGERGRLQLSGELDRSEAAGLRLALQAEAFETGWLHPDYPGQINADLSLQAQREASGWSGELALQRLDGRLRDRPLRGEGRWRLSASGSSAGRLQIALGDSRLLLQAEDERADQLRLQLDPLRLADVLNDAAGELRGELSLFGLARPQALMMDLDLRALRWGEYSLKQGRAHGRLDRDLPATDWSLTARGLSAPSLDSVEASLQLRGDGDGYRLALQAEHALGRLQADWRGRHDDEQRQLRELRLDIDSPRWGRWQLPAGAVIDYRDALRLPRHCLRGEPGAICAESNPAGALQLQLEQLSLEWLRRAAGGGDALAVEGVLDGRFELIPGPAGWQPGAATLTLSAGSLRDVVAEPLTLIGWTALRADAALEQGRWRVEGELALDDGGRIGLRAELPWQPQPQWAQARGQLEVDVRQLRPLSLLAPDLVDPQGRLSGQLDYDAARGDPLRGQLQLDQLAGALPALGVVLQPSRLELFAQDGRIQLDGLLETGEGGLRLEGEVSRLTPWTARMRLAGQRVRIANAPRLQLLLSPELDVQLRSGRVRVRGEVGVPQARIDLERIEAGEARSDDVVVLDPAQPEAARLPLLLDVDIGLDLGDQVQLAGFGFDGRLGGRLRIIERPGQPARGRGNLDLSGQYRAYGQNLEIERGRLLFASSPLDNPAIDLRARRALREVTVGIAVTGAARRPRLSLWSEPALEQAEVLSYLVLGQPLRSAGSEQGSALGQAAAAVGGNLLAAQVGSRLGFDTFGVADSAALGGAAFTVGKYLSPRLYLSYGVALFDSARAISLRYLLNQRLDVELESARESRVGINYRLETD